VNPSRRIDTLAVVGGGFMGLGIAEAAAVRGLPVTVVDTDDRQVGGAPSRMAKSLDRAVAGGKLTRSERDQALGLLQPTRHLGDIADADLVIEAVPENLELKVEVMREIELVVDSSTIVASNTSSIPIAELAAVFERSERVLGLHFFAPVPVMRLVEIVAALNTSAATLAAGREFAERIGKRPIMTKDRSGFVVNMLLVPYLMAGVRMYEEGFATREDIDEGMRLGCGHPMGPLTLCDFIGLDVLYAVCDSLYEEFKRAEYAPPPLLKRMVASGRLGRKSGRGFYEYPDLQGSQPVGPAREWHRTPREMSAAPGES
jgi:3-hydroxybutyryl-CoA dehydrogenase